MKKLVHLSLLLVCLPATACVTVHFTPLQEYSRPARPVGSVEFFRMGMPNRPYREVGILRISSTVGYDAAMQKLMEAGANYGCDAVAGINAGVSTTVGYGYYGAYAHQHDEITASCLLYEATPPSAPGAPPPSSMPPPMGGPNGMPPQAPPPSGSDQ